MLKTKEIHSVNITECSKIPQWKISHRIETKKSFCNANRLIGFYPIWVFIKNDYWTAQNTDIKFFTKHTSMILRVHILHKLDSCQGKVYKKRAEVTTNLSYLTHKKLQFSKPFSTTLHFSWDLNHLFCRSVWYYSQSRNNYDCQRQNVQKVPAAYVPHLLGISYHFPYNCSNISENHQLWNLHTVDYKPYKTINKLALAITI